MPPTLKRIRWEPTRARGVSGRISEGVESVGHDIKVSSMAKEAETEERRVGGGGGGKRD